MKGKTSVKVFAKYGSRLRITNNIGVEVAKLDWTETLKFRQNYKQGKLYINHASILSNIEVKYIKGSYKSSPEGKEVYKFEGYNSTKHLE